ncbi:MAG: Mut7-C RNAse domain-containing protein [Gammaproteobacteria bacterium]
MATAELRFYEELNDFLPPERRKRTIRHTCAEQATVKNAIESLGVPHTEVELVLVNGRSVGLAHRVQDGDRISVYPKFESLDISPLLRVRERPLREVRFVADAQLGGVAKYLRLLGFDTLYRNDYDDAKLARISAAEHRIVLTRDRDLLMHRVITHGCYVRALRPDAQLQEVLVRLDLFGSVRPFSRCLRCNGGLVAIDKAALGTRIRETTLQVYNEFWTCRGCNQVYWAGPHFRRLQEVVDSALRTSDLPRELWPEP